MDIFDGAILGDFSDDMSLTKLISQVVVGLIPVVGQVADVRDIIASLRNIKTGRDGAWLGLGLAILAIIPGFDAFKASKILKPIFDVLGEKGAREFAEFLLRNPDQAGRVAKNFAYLLDHPELIELLSKNPDAALHMIRRWEPEWIEMVAELHRRDIKFDPAQIQAMTRDSSGRVVFLETGAQRAGLNHILTEHHHHFAARGISQEKIPDFLMTAIREGEIVGTSGRDRSIYKVLYDGREHFVAISIADNGFVVGANPVRWP